MAVHDKTNGSEEGSAPGGGTIWVVALVLGLLMFSVNYGLTRSFDRLNVFAEPNILLHADPKFRLESFVTGWGWSDRNLVHPNLGNYFSIPLAAISKGVARTGLYSGNELELRRALALMLVPLFSAGTVAFFFVSLRRAGFPIGQAVLATILVGGSFSQLLFGSLPDHFAISGFCLAAACWLAVETLRRRRIAWLAWLALGVFAVGITITNLIWLGILFVLPLGYVRREWKVFVPASVWAVAVLAGTGLFAELGNRLHANGSHLWSFPEAKRYGDDFSPEGILKLTQAPAALANTFSPPSLNRVPNTRAVETNQGRDYMFSLENVSSFPRNLVILVLLATGIAGWLVDRSPFRVVAAACLTIVLLNLLMHAIWSVEYVVFSQHWLVPAVFVLAGNFRLPHRFRQAAAVGLAAMSIGMIWQNALTLQKLHTTLRYEAPAAFDVS